MELEPIINSFEIEGSIETIQKLNKGLINTTYLVSTKDRKYIFQSINTSIFKNIEAIFLAKKSKERVRLLLRFVNHQITADVPASDIGEKEIIEAFKL